ncbi:MAG: tetratricopeptide repeat protein [Candidatus Polarisedimenticolia bacterium]
MTRPSSPAAAALGLTALLAACSAPPPPGAAPERPFAGESLKSILSHADAAFAGQDYAEAEPAYEEAIRLDPEHGPAAANLGSCYLHNRKVRKAREFLEGFLARHPGDLGARLVLARVFVRQGENARAAEILDGVVRDHPDLLMARYNLGFISYRLRRYPEAERHLRRAVELRPEFPEGFYSLGLTYLAIGRIADATGALEKVVSLDPRHVGARFNLAGAYARAGRMKEAEAQQAAFADLSGRSKTQQEREARIKASSVEAIRHLQEGRLEEALAEYEALAARFPDDAPLWNEVGRLQQRLGKREAALASFHKAIGLDSGLSQPHYLLSELYREMGDAAAAQRELEIFAALETIPEGKSGY